MSAEKIRELNDRFRITMTGGHVMMTAGVDALPSDVKAMVIRRVATFSDFNADNDPHGEHDFGSFTLTGGGHDVTLGRLSATVTLAGGLAGVGLSLPGLLRARADSTGSRPADPGFGRARSGIMIYLHGGPAQHAGHLAAIATEGAAFDGGEHVALEHDCRLPASGKGIGGGHCGTPPTVCA